MKRVMNFVAIVIGGLLLGGALILNFDRNIFGGTEESRIYGYFAPVFLLLVTIGGAARLAGTYPTRWLRDRQVPPKES